MLTDRKTNRGCFGKYFQPKGQLTESSCLTADLAQSPGKYSQDHGHRPTDYHGFFAPHWTLGLPEILWNASNPVCMYDTLTLSPAVCSNPENNVHRDRVTTFLTLDHFALRSFTGATGT
jgi:hypothetical protein